MSSAENRNLKVAIRTFGCEMNVRGRVHVFII